MNWTLVALLGTYIGLWNNNRQIKHLSRNAPSDLYDRRKAIYDAALRFLADMRFTSHVKQSIQEAEDANDMGVV